MTKLSHLDADGTANMVDVSAKAVSKRTSIAYARLKISTAAMAEVTSIGSKKGDLFGTARIAAIMAAKKTGDLIPLCHPLSLDFVGVTFARDAEALYVRAECSVGGKTGVEMESLVAATIGATTLYDMIKAIDKSAVIDNVFVARKTGGKSGDFEHASPPFDTGALDWF